MVDVLFECLFCDVVVKCKCGVDCVCVVGGAMD